MIATDSHQNNGSVSVSVVFSKEDYAILQKIATAELSKVPHVIRRHVAPTINTYKKTVLKEES